MVGRVAAVAGAVDRLAEMAAPSVAGGVAVVLCGGGGLRADVGACAGAVGGVVSVRAGVALAVLAYAPLGPYSCA